MIVGQIASYNDHDFCFERVFENCSDCVFIFYRSISFVTEMCINMFQFLFVFLLLSLNLKQMNKILKQFIAYDYVYMFVVSNFLSIPRTRGLNHKAMIAQVLTLPFPAGDSRKKINFPRPSFISCTGDIISRHYRSLP